MGRAGTVAVGSPWLGSPGLTFGSDPWPGHRQHIGVHWRDPVPADRSRPGQVPEAQRAPRAGFFVASRRRLEATGRPAPCDDEAVLDVRRLLVLRAVAQHGSLAAAARQLGYTQPAVSHHIHRLEAETGVRLVIRDGRGVKLTEAAQALVARAEAIDAELAAAEAQLAAFARTAAGHVRLAALPSSNATLVPAALADLAARGLDITVSLVEAGPDQAFPLLQNAECDLAITFDHPTLPAPAGLVTVPLLDDHLRDPARQPPFGRGGRGRPGPARHRAVDHQRTLPRPDAARLRSGRVHPDHRPGHRRLPAGRAAAGRRRARRQPDHRLRQPGRPPSRHHAR